MTRPIKFRAWDGSKYDIGSDGSIWSNDFNNSGKRGQLKKYNDKKDGYKIVYLTIDGVRRVHAVRKLVALTYLGERPEGLVINHKNGIRSDDRVENLEYITSQANTIDGWKRGRKITEKHRENGRKQFTGTNNPKAKITRKDVTLMRNQRNHGLSLKTLSEMFKISIAQVSAICTNRNWK